MVFASALFLLVAVPEAGAFARARATARIVAAEEIDFERPIAQRDASPVLIRLMRSRAVEGSMRAGSAAALQLVEFQ